jgi:hypothetical protein
VAAATRAPTLGPMADWPTIASLATAVGTLVLAAATFVSVRSANRAARAAERSLLAGVRPLLAPSRLQDPAQKVIWQDRHVERVEGGRAAATVTEEAIYLAASLRNSGNGVAVLHGWHVYPEWRPGAEDHVPLDEFRRLSRDILIASGDPGFWQGTVRDPADPLWDPLAKAIDVGDRLTVDILYGDHEGGQRTIVRLSFTPYDSGDDRGYLCGTSRYWNIDQPDPR